MSDPQARSSAAEHAEDVKNKALSGAKTMGVQTIYSIGLRVLSSLFLSRLLINEDYATFGVAAQIIALGMFLSDGGLAGGLVQRKEEPTAKEIFTLFICQQAMVLFFIVGLTLALPLVQKSYRMDEVGKAITLAMTWGLLLYSLRIVPLLKLQRGLQIREMARIELIENTIRTLVTIGLAFMHLGPWALAGGQIIGLLISLTLVWSVARWVPKGQFDLRSIAPLLRFGLPYQFNIVLPVFVALPIPAIIVRTLGEGVFGNYVWALTIGGIPMMLNNALIKISFAAYSRVQDDPEALGQFVKKSTRRLGALMGTLGAVMILGAPPAVPILFGSHWIPAIPLLQWLFVDATLGAFVGNLAAVQNATGRPMERSWVSLGLGIVRWISIYLSCRYIGEIGLVSLGIVLPTFIEAIITAHLVQRNNPGCKGILRDLLEPILAIGIVTAAALYIGHLAAPGSVWISTFVSFAAFVLLTLVRETGTPFRVLASELPGVLALLRRNPV